MAQRDYYEVLGVPRSATPEELKAAFRRLARQFHPDVNKAPDAEENFKEINEAYAILSDPDQRAAYDRFGHAGVRNGSGMPDMNNMDWSDILGDLFNLGGFGRSQQMRNAPRRGADLSYRLELTFKEAVFGVEKEIVFTRDEVCSVCAGSGAKPGSKPTTCTTCKGAGEVRQVRQTILGSMVQVSTCPTCRGHGTLISSPCSQCNGSGLERKTVRKNVPIPAGVDSGNQIRLAGEGQPGENGGPAGNFFILIQVQPHKYFRRHDFDINLDLKINYAQAALGAEVEVPTVEDVMAKLIIPPGTQPGATLVLKGRGVPRLRASGRGDQRIMINVEVPKHLTAEQRDLLEKLAETMDSEVLPAERGFFDWVKETLGF